MPSDTEAEPVAPSITSQEEEDDQDYLDRLFPKGLTVDEAVRKREWLALPRETRASIRRLHKIMGHKPKAVMAVIMKATRVPEAHLNGA